MDALRVHRVNFFEPEPKSIHSLAYDEHISRLAVSRSDFSIEIWDVQQNPYIEKRIPGDSNNSVEAITWCKGRLFSVGLHGTITEYDLKFLKPKYNVIVTSGCPIWCLSVNKQKTFLATGNEDGHVVLHQITSYGVELEKKFDKQEGRILCLAWHESGETIVTGSIDTIRLWNVNTGQVITRIIIGRTNRNTETIVWCIAVTSDMTIISGDSRGKTSFWDAHTGTLLSSVGAHKADVLALSLSKDENTVFTSGVDPIIIMHMKAQLQSSVDSETKRKWMKSVQRIVHTHDVRALQLVGEFVVSGGVDCNLVFSKFPPKTVIKFFPFTQVSHCSVAPKAAHILLQYPNFLEVWKLGSTTHVSNIDGEQLPLNELPQKLLKIKAQVNEVIICSSISADGKWIAYSSLHKLRLFHIEKRENTSDIPVVHKIVLPEHSIAAYSLLFTSSETKLIVYDKSKIHIVKCDTVQTELLSCLEDELDEAHLFELSPNDVYLACGNHNGKILIYNFRTLKLLCKLPQYKCQPTVLKFDATSENLMVVYSDRKIVEYNVEKQSYTNWSRNHSLSDFQSSSFYPVTNIIFYKNRLIFQDESAIYIIEKTEQIKPEKKRLKNIDETNADVQICTEKIQLKKVVKKYEHISSIHSLLDDLIIVEISPSQVLNALPPPLHNKKYGT